MRRSPLSFLNATEYNPDLWSGDFFRMADGRPWLDAAASTDAGGFAPALSSERGRDLIARALLHPGSLLPAEVQELAASALRQLVADSGR